MTRENARQAARIASIAMGMLGSVSLFADERLEIKQPEQVAPVAEAPKVDPAVTPTGCDDCAFDGRCCDGCCGRSRPVCCAKCVTRDVKKHCWLVKPEWVCIPGFRLPWERRRKSTGGSCCDTCCSTGCDGACAPKCGRLRCVNVLEKHEYKCKECGYEWEVKCVRRGGRRTPCEDGGCPGCGCSVAGEKLGN